jgi:alpha,alpha-trehalose phosphorylase
VETERLGVEPPRAVVVELGPETVTYALHEGEGLVIRHETEEIPLTPKQPQAFRLASRW